MKPRRSYDRFCPLSLALDQVGDRWTLLVVTALLRGASRYGEIDRFVSGAGSNVLSDRLRRLIEAGMVSRMAPPEPGRSPVYELTERGAALAPVIAQLSDWGLGLLVPDDPASLPPEGRLFDQLWTSRTDADRLPREVYQWHVGESSFYFEVEDFSVRQFAGVAKKPTVTLRLKRESIERRIRGELDWDEALESGEAELDGPPDAAERMLRVTGLA